MGATRLNLEIYAHCPKFRDEFQLQFATHLYLQFKSNRHSVVKSVCICKTSSKCYRVMSYIESVRGGSRAEYVSYRSISDLCHYLENLAFEKK